MCSGRISIRWKKPADVIDFDVSNDGNYLAYSMAEEGFTGNSDIYFRNLLTEATTRLTLQDSISSINPKIFPNNSKVAYVRRVYSTSTHKLSDGEIWVIDSDGNQDSLKKLFSSDILTYDPTDICSQEALDGNVRIGINDIGSDNKTIAYWKAAWAHECSGIWSKPYFSKIDGDFFIPQFLNENKFSYLYEDTNTTKQFNWQVNKIFWLNNGQMIINNGAMPPFSGSSEYLVGADQKRIWKIFDTYEDDIGGLFSQFMNFNDVLQTNPNTFLAIYSLYFNPYDDSDQSGFSGYKYFIGTFTVGDTVTARSLLDNQLIDSGGLELLISDMRILNSSTVLYVKAIGNNEDQLIMHDVVTGQNTTITNSGKSISFDI
jgi:hypothetical protein